MASERAFAGGFVFAVLLRAAALATLLVALFFLLRDTSYYATMLVLALCAVFIVIDLSLLTGRHHRAVERFLDSLSGGALEAPALRGALPASLQASYVRTLDRLHHDRQQRLLRGEYLQTLLDTVPAGLLVLHADGRIDLMNRAAHRLLGEAAPRLIDLPSLGDEAARQLAELAPGAHRVVQLKSGRRLLASAAQFSSPEGASERLLSLQRLAGDLDAVSLAAWDDMARVLAHEMMNSLTPIASLSQSLETLLRSGDRSAEVTEALEAISRRSQGLLRFVERYRQVADLPDPRLQLLSLGPLLANVERLIGPSLAERDIALQVSVEPPQLAVRADRDLVEQALLNLLRNAADAAAESASPQVQIHCAHDGDLALIEIRDNGPGMTPAQREQVFVPFFTTKPDGSGIGLSLARRIVQAHGGKLTAHANTPQGSTLRMALPGDGL